MAWEPDYVTRDQFKNYVKIDLNDTVDDTFIDLDITSASRAVDQHCSIRKNGLGARRQFGQVAAPEARYYTPRWDNDLIKWVIEIDDLMDITGLTIAIDLDLDDIYESPLTQYILRPRDALQRNRPYTQIAIAKQSNIQPASFVDTAKVIARYGWTSVLSVVTRATLIQAHRFNKRRVSPFGTAGSPQKNTEDSIKKHGMNSDVDPDVAQMLETADLVKLGWTL